VRGAPTEHPHGMDSIDVRQLVGRTAVGRDGRLGRVEDLLLDERTREPAWMAVATPAGARFVPLAEAQAYGDDVLVPYDAGLVGAAPHVEPDGHLSAEEEHRLYTHYGFRWVEDEAPTAVTEPVAAHGEAVEVTRSEEELHVGVERRVSGRTRLRKVVVTDTVTTTVPLRHEVLHIEREPIGEAEAGAHGGPLFEEEHEVVLLEERAVVSKEVVPKERVRLRKEAIVEEQAIEAEVRRERIEAEEDRGGR
jgi:uncharacterized protein (TIGR02271 family)